MTFSSIAAIALDTGTTSIKAGLLDQHGILNNIVVQPAPRITVNNGRYESDALAYAAAVDKVLAVILDKADGCRTFGLCSQRSSFLVWEKAGGRPLTPLISWQDSRGAASCEALRTHEKSIRELTGLPLTPYYFAPKLRVLLQENPGWLARLVAGELLVGTLDTFLVWLWTGGKLHVTDASMAARTLLLDIRQQKWSPILCELFGVPLHILPQIKSSTGMGLILDNELILEASVGDQSAALFASVREDRPEVLVNLGTGCFVVRCIQENKLAEEQAAMLGYLQALVYQDERQNPHFAIEGTLNSIAPALAPFPVSECRAEDLAVDDIFCLAEPSGLGAPYFRSDIGVRFSDPIDYLSRNQIAVLLLEAVIFRIARILEDFQRESAIERVYLSGGLSELACLRRGLAGCASLDIYHLRHSEASLQGAALLAAGMPQASSRDAEKLPKANENNALCEKYKRWKDWLDSLLE